MYRTLIPLALLAACGGGETESTDRFRLENVQIVETVGNQVELAGDIVLLDASGAGGVTGKAVFYRDDYATQLASANGVIGQGLEAEGDRESFALSAIQARLEPHEDGYLRICVDLQVDDSNYAEVTEVGCLDGEEPEPTTTTTTTPPAEEPPTVEIYAPFEEELFGIGETMFLDGRCTDPNQANDTLTVVWTYENLDGAAGPQALTTEPIEGSGDTFGQWEAPPLGDYEIVLSCTDDAGNEVSDLRTVSVVDRDLVDLDGDGVTPYGGDCNDSDATISPNAEEACDGVDRDCSGYIDDKDLDGDGHVDEACVNNAGALPTDDCDDLEPTAYTGATEVPGNGIDEDCDGYDT